MDLVHRQTLVINSSDRADGHAWDFTVTLPPETVRCRADQSMRITLQQLDFFNDFPNVRPGSNVIGFELDDPDADVVQVTISPGVQTAQDLARQINAAYPLVQCDFVESMNAFAFDFRGVSHTLWLYDDTAELFGFSPLAIRTGTFLGSDVHVDPYPVKAVCVKLLGVSQRGTLNMTTAPSGAVVQNPVLAVVPVTAEPYTWQTYTSLADDYFSVEITDKDVSQLRFLFCDRDGRVLSDKVPMTESSLILRIDTVGGGDGSAKGFELLSKQLERLLEVQKVALLANYLTEEDVAPQ